MGACLLAYVYSKTGRNLALLQLQHGYAQQWVIGDNDKYWRCFQQAELQARQRKRGLWRDMRVLSASEVSSADKGYTHIEGEITAIESNDQGMQLILDRRLIVSISKDKLALFNKSGVELLLHDKLLLSGKLTFYRSSPKIRLYHPVQILP